MKTGIFLGLLLFCCACSPHNGPLSVFRKLSPHDQYGQRLADAGLANTALGHGWIERSRTIVTAPLAISLPYAETGYFPADKAEAAALSFSAKRGQKLSIAIDKKPFDLMIYA